jgi:hypothetical protein
MQRRLIVRVNHPVIRAIMLLEKLRRKLLHLIDGTSWQAFGQKSRKPAGDVSAHFTAGDPLRIVKQDT